MSWTFPYLVFDYDYAGEALVYDGNADDSYAPEGYIDGADVGRGYYDDDYVYTS